MMKKIAKEKVKERFSRVINIVKSNIIEYGRTFQMEVLADIFDEDSADQKQTANLKNKFQNEFPDELLYLNVTITCHNWPYRDVFRTLLNI